MERDKLWTREHHHLVLPACGNGDDEEVGLQLKSAGADRSLRFRPRNR